ncbi:MAG: hypothetical protein ACYSWZ_26905 [Planctomycetota bacterium]|jgi:hypothetical protein
MPKGKAGLHKQVSSIFTGVPVPTTEDKDAEQASPTETKEQPTYGPPSHLSGTTMKEVLQSKLAPQKDIPTPTEKPEAVEKKEKKAAQVQKPVKIQSSGPSALEQMVQRIKDKLFAPQAGVNPVRQKAMVVLVPVMFIGMVLAFLKVLGGGPDETTGPKVITPSNTIAAASSTIDWKIPDLYPTTLRDPMQFKKEVVVTPTGNPDKTEEIVIKGILYDEENPSVIIGVDILHEGDKVLGATIVKINKDNVEFEMNGKKWTQKAR